MGRRVAALAVAAALLLPPAASAKTVVRYAGTVQGVTDPNPAITFNVVGRTTKKGRLIPKAVRGIALTVPWRCYSATEYPVGSSQRNDLPFGSITAPTDKNGSFFGRVIAPDNTVLEFGGQVRRGAAATGTVSANHWATPTNPYPGCGTNLYSIFWYVAWNARPVGPGV